MKNTRSRKTKALDPKEWAKDFKQMSALYAHAFGVEIPTPGSISSNHSTLGFNHHRYQETQPMITDNASETTAQHRDLFDTYVRRSLPDIGTVDASENVPRQLLDGIAAQSSVEEMLGSLMVAAYAQAIKLVGKSNERLGPFSIPYEKANPEAMGYMRVVCQLATILLKFRKEKVQESILEHEGYAVAPVEDSTSDS